MSKTEKPKRRSESDSDLPKVKRGKKQAGQALIDAASAERVPGILAAIENFENGNSEIEIPTSAEPPVDAKKVASVKIQLECLKKDLGAEAFASIRNYTELTECLQNRRRLKGDRALPIKPGTLKNTFRDLARVASTLPQMMVECGAPDFAPEGSPPKGDWIKLASDMEILASSTPDPEFQSLVERGWTLERVKKLALSRREDYGRSDIGYLLLSLGTLSDAGFRKDLHSLVVWRSLEEAQLPENRSTNGIVVNQTACILMVNSHKTKQQHGSLIRRIPDGSFLKKDLVSFVSNSRPPTPGFVRYLFETKLGSPMCVSTYNSRLKQWTGENSFCSNTIRRMAAIQAASLGKEEIIKIAALQGQLPQTTLRAYLARPLGYLAPPSSPSSVTDSPPNSCSAIPADPRVEELLKQIEALEKRIAFSDPVSSI